MFTYNVYRNALKRERRLNILSFCHDGLFEYMLAQAFPEHYFYGLYQQPHWMQDILNLPNLEWISCNSFPQYLDADLLICNDKLDNFDSYQNLSFTLHLPVIGVEHTTVPMNMRPEDRYIINSKRKFHKDISILDIVNTSWGRESVVIPYGLDTPEKVEKTDQILLIGDFQQKDYQHIQEFIRNTPTRIKVLGHTPGISKPPESWDSLLQDFAESSLFLCLSSSVNHPILLLYAMAYGCVPIANSTPLLDHIISESQSGLIGRNMDEIKTEINKITAQPHQIQNLSANAIRYIQDNFSPEQFQENWEEVWQTMSNKAYQRI